MKNDQRETQPEACRDCGHSVTWGSGRFVNRVPADDEWLCAECISRIYDEDSPE